MISKERVVSGMRIIDKMKFGKLGKRDKNNTFSTTILPVPRFELGNHSRSNRLLFRDDQFRLLSCQEGQQLLVIVIQITRNTLIDRRTRFLTGGHA